MPSQVFIRFPEDFFHRPEAIIIEKTPACSHKSSIYVLPEIHSVGISFEIPPQGCRRDAITSGRFIILVLSRAVQKKFAKTCVEIHRKGYCEIAVEIRFRYGHDQMQHPVIFIVSRFAPE